MDSGKNTKSKEKSASALFMAVVVLVGAVLFLISDKGKSFLASIGVEAAETQVSLNGDNDCNEECNGSVPCAPEDIIAAMLENWSGASAVNTYADIGKSEYRVRGKAIEAETTFKIEDGIVSSLTIEYMPPAVPEVSKGELSPIEEYIQKKNNEEYQQQNEDVRQMLQALLIAVNGGSTYQLDSTLNLLESAAVSAAESAKVNSFEAMGTKFKVYTVGSKAERMVAISIELYNE